MNVGLKNRKMIMRKKTISTFFLMSIVGIFIFSSFTGHLPGSFQERWKAPAWADTLKNPFSNQPEMAEQGKKLYDLYCWNCHGKTGLGDGAAGTDLGVHPANFHDKPVKKQSDGALFWKMATGRGNMASYKDLLTEEQRWQLVAYIRQLANQR